MLKSTVLWNVFKNEKESSQVGIHLISAFFVGNLKAVSQTLRSIQEGKSNVIKKYVKQRVEYIMAPFRQAEICYRINDVLDGMRDISPYICNKKGSKSLFIVYGQYPPGGYYSESYIRGALYGENGYRFRTTYRNSSSVSSSSIRYDGGKIFYVKWGYEHENGNHYEESETPVFECHFDNMTCYSKTRQPRRFSAVQFRKIVDNLKP